MSRQTDFFPSAASPETGIVTGGFDDFDRSYFCPVSCISRLIVQTARVQWSQEAIASSGIGQLDTIIERHQRTVHIRDSQCRASLDPQVDAAGKGPLERPPEGRSARSRNAVKRAASGT